MMENEKKGFLEEVQEFDLAFSKQVGCENNKAFLIPVVFHILHNNGPENISEAQIDDALAQLNLQFAGGEGGFNTQIQFVRAKIDPQGNCSTGINRILTSNPEAQYSSYLDDVAMKNLSRWPTDNYVNIWIVRCIQPDIDCNDQYGISGYATPPGISPNPEVDGIVVSHKFLGSIGTSNSNTTNTLTHEMGHYLSLLHVWGQEWGNTCAVNCSDINTCNTLGDRVCDTEPCIGTLYSLDCTDEPTNCQGCTGFPTGVYIFPKSNYMSYNHECQNRFTECQSFKMKFALENYRTGLWSKSNLICTGSGGFYGNDIVIKNNTTWTTANLPNGGEITITGSLTIEMNPIAPNTPVTLNIGSGVIVHFCGNGKIVVKPNTTLDLSGSLTNSCKEPWKGIEVWGDNSKSQVIVGGKRAQGRLIGRNGSTIENAKTGVQLWGPDYYSNAGGQISCSGTTFRNNFRGVEFAPYENFWPLALPPGWQNQVRNYEGVFSKCSFETNDNFPSTQQFHSFLHMTGVRGVSIFGSTFTNSRSISSNNFVD
jgi:hypothetical protein